MTEFFLLFVGMGLPIFFGGMVFGIWFTVSGGIYVNEYGVVDFRWPPKRKRLTPHVRRTLQRRKEK